MENQMIYLASSPLLIIVWKTQRIYLDPGTGPPYRLFVPEEVHSQVLQRSGVDSLLDVVSKVQYWYTWRSICPPTCPTNSFCLKNSACHWQKL